MKKLISYILIIVILLMNLTGCNDNTTKVKEKEVIESDNNISVDIISSKSEFGNYDYSVVLTPKLKGDYNKELQYRWILENENDFVGFSIPENGPQKEIINLGEAVELSSNEIVKFVPDAYEEFKVRLEVQEKDTGKVIAEKEIKIENHAGLYKIIGASIRDNSLSEEAIIVKVYEQLTQENKEHLKNTYKNSTIDSIILRKDMGRITDESYIGKEVYIVNFLGTGNYEPNNIVVFASLEECKIIGYAYLV